MADRICLAIVAFRRFSRLPPVLESIRQQRAPVSEIVVVDNDDDPKVEAFCVEHGLTYLPQATNIGPAGGTAVAMTHFIEHYGDDDWFIRLDDDKPFPDDALLADLHAFAMAARAGNSRFGGVGLAGSTWDYKKARLSKVSIPDDQPGAQVDYLATNYFPLWNGRAIRTVGPIRGDMFFGFSEVEYGLRLRRVGFDLWLHGERVIARRGGSDPPSDYLPSARLGVPGWRRYYSLRNTIVVAREYCGMRVAIWVTLERAIAKPLVNAPRSPRLAWAHLRLGARAAFDAWTGAMGRQLDPVEWERNHGLLTADDEMRST